MFDDVYVTGEDSFDDEKNIDLPEHSYLLAPDFKIVFQDDGNGM